ncbi:translation initiation factor IF-1 [Patescibacteria group bacterium]
MVKEKGKILTGRVIEALPNTNFKVILDDSGEEVTAHISGKMRMYRIKVLVGDKVSIEFSPYGGKGRINRRF